MEGDLEVMEEEKKEEKKEKARGEICRPLERLAGTTLMSSIMSSTWMLLRYVVKESLMSSMKVIVDLQGSKCQPQAQFNRHKYEIPLR